ncbi:MAG: lysophospholipid acyltransferase family protein [Armatimonadetes bacterium]|nr:lysophospholipid acyltransferase family protein [Armatimonadota bacterium]
MKHPLRRRLEQGTVAFAARVVRLLSWLPLAWLRRLADFGAWVTIAVTPRRQRLADANVAAAFPELSAAQRRGIIRRSIWCLTRTMVELFALPRLSKEDLARLIATPDLSPMREAAQSGAGVLFVTAHFGNWEWLGAHLVHQVAPLAVVARDHRHKGLAAMVNGARRSHGVRDLAREDVRGMLRVLSSGGMLGMLPDQHPISGGVRVDFLGRPAWTFTGPAVLAARTGARAFVGFCVREPSGFLRVVVLPELQLVHTDDTEADVVTNTQLINDAIGYGIREYPDNWLWLHDRWRERGAPVEYE